MIDVYIQGKTGTILSIYIYVVVLASERVSMWELFLLPGFSSGRFEIIF